jgi:undecaprenyl diphosphate synthase
MSKTQLHAALPAHVAIVMDGNGRWANKRFLPRVAGHKQGVDALVRIVQACADRGIQHLTVFAFSSENWRRPEEEVSGLMSLMMSTVAKHLGRLEAQGVRIRIVGDRAQVSEKVRGAWDEAEQGTSHNSRLNLNVAFNYGGRWDVVQACQHAVADGLTPEQITEERLSGYMALRHAPDPDLFIRTGGEFRISNFLLWQAAYSELYFTDCLWPDFDDAQLDAALAEFARRDRRFGAVKGASAAASAPSESA